MTSIATEEAKEHSKERPLEQIAEDIAYYVVNKGDRLETLKTLLIEFAEEIKREAIEP